MVVEVAVAANLSALAVEVVAIKEIEMVEEEALIAVAVAVETDHVALILAEEIKQKKIPNHNGWGFFVLTQYFILPMLIH
jgi:hypothetical protein